MRDRRKRGIHGRADYVFNPGEGALEEKVLGCGESPKWSRDQEGLHIWSGFVSDIPVVFHIPSHAS